MSKDTIANDWTATILRFNAHTPTGRAALAVQLSSVTAGAVYELHLSGAASGTGVPPKLEIDTDCDASDVITPFAVSSITGTNGRAFFDDQKIIFLVDNKKGGNAFKGKLESSFPTMFFKLSGIYLLKSVTNFKSSASTTEIFTNPPRQPLVSDMKTLN